MKRILILISFAFSLSSVAQITLNAGDFPEVGNRFLLSSTQNVSAVNVLNISAKGLQNWDFSSLSADYTDTADLVKPTLTSKSALLQKPDFGYKTLKNTGAANMDYYTISSSKYELVGGYYPGGTGYIVYDNFVLMNFPASYGNSWEGTSKVLLKAYPAKMLNGVDSLMEKISSDYSVSVDAYGSISTKLLNNEPCIRVKETIKPGVDSLFKHVTATGKWAFLSVTYTGLKGSNTYKWYSKGKGEVARIECDAADRAFNATWLSSMKPLAIEEASLHSKIGIQPNPATSEVTFSFASAGNKHIELFNVKGKNVENVDVNNSANYKLDTGTFTAGLYFVRVYDTTTNNVSTGKFVIKN